MLRRRLVPATQRLVEWWTVGRVIISRVAEVYEKVPSGTPSARVPFRLSTKILALAWIGRMERVWVHTSWIEHDVLRCTVTGWSDKEQTLYTNTNIPMSNVIFVHKFHALSRLVIQVTRTKFCCSHLTYLREKSDEFPESPNWGIVISTQQRVDQDWWVPRQLDNVEQTCTMISRV